MEIYLEMLVLVLLGLTIIFCWRLHIKINDIKDGKKELTSLINHFDTVIINTHKSIASLKEITNKTASEIKNSINQAENVNNELSLIISLGNSLLDKLEQNLVKLENKKTTKTSKKIPK